MDGNGMKDESPNDIEATDEQAIALDVIVDDAEDRQDLTPLNMKENIAFPVEQVSVDNPSENMIEQIVDNSEFSIISFPDYSKTNPYQNGLYSSFAESSSLVYGNIEKAIALINERKSKNYIFHLHWPEPIFAGVKNGHEHDVRAMEFISNVKNFQSLGGIFIWTIHNRLSHDRKFGDQEIAFLQSLSDAANGIHIHNEASLPLINEYYSVDPRKCLVVPHGSYEGSYGPAFDKAQCRDMLGLPRDKTLFVFCGQIRPYKGIDELVVAFNAISAGRDDAHLLITGKPLSGFTSAHARLIEESNPNIHVREGFVPDSKLPLIIGAADFVVLPYREILTSGSIMLAATYGKPVITPDLATLSVVGENGIGLQYAQGEDGALEQALRDALALDADKVQAIGLAATSYASSLNWTNVSNLLQEKIRENLLPKEEIVQVDHVSRSVSVLRKMDKTAVVGVAIVYYHSWDDITNLLKTIPFEIDGKNVKIYVFDNSSKAGFNYKLISISDVYVTSHENLGYAAANNILMAMMKDDGCDYAFIVNPDTSLRKNSLKILLDNATPDAVQSPLILNEDSTIGYGGGRIRHDVTGQVHVDHLLEREPLSAAPLVPYPVHTLNGCALFVPCALLDQIGYIPEDYFLYYEETDWCLSIADRGGKLLVEPRAHIVHHKKSKAGNFPALHYTYYLIRNKFIFSQKWNASDSARNPDAIARDVMSSFVAPWKLKLEINYPDLLPVFERCVQAAIEDGKAGIVGKVDVSARLDAVYLPDRPTSAGQVDKTEGHIVTGWISAQSGEDGAWLPGSAWLFKNGSPLCSVVPSRPRPDVGNAGFGHGTGFSVEVPQANDGEHHDFEIRASSDGRRVQISDAIDSKSWFKADEKIASRPSKLRSFIETVANGRLTGWAADTAHPDVLLKLDIYIDGELVAAGIPSADFRQDLLGAGIGNGCHAFALPVFNKFLLRPSLQVVIKLAGGDYVLLQKTVPVLNNSLGFSPEFDINAYLRWAYIEERMAIGHSESAFTLLKQFEMEKRRWLARAAAVREQPLVSIIMPVFNRAQIVQDSIQSVLDQSYGNFELIVVDDGSTDDSVDAVRAITDKRLDLIILEENQGVSAARNAGLVAARGEIIAYLDSDNLWDKDFLNIMVAAMVSNPQHGSAYSGQFIYQNFGYGVQGSDLSEQRLVRFAPFNRSRMEERNFIDLNVFVHRKSLYDQFGGFDVSLRRLVDWDLILRYTRDTSPVMVPCLLSNYYIGKSDNQITAVEDFISNRSALKIVSPINLLSFGGKDQNPLNIIVRCQSEADLTHWVAANRKLLRSADGMVLGLCEADGGVTGFTAHVRDLVTGKMDGFRPCDAQSYMDAVRDTVAYGQASSLLITASAYAVGSNWHAVLQRAEAAGDFFAATGRAYAKPKASRFGNLYNDLTPAKVVDAIEAWSISPDLQGQIINKMSGEYFFVFGKFMPDFSYAADITENIDEMITVAFGYAKFEGHNFIYTPEIIAAEHHEIPDFILS